jgi:putative endonuclease
MASGQPSARHHPHALGRAGEELAARWYTEHGYEVLERNWRCSAGEADLIALRGPLLVICEVKARSSDRFGRPAEAVNRTRQLRLRRTAACYLGQVGQFGSSGLRPRVVRFDVAEVLGGTLSVIEDAF